MPGELFCKERWSRRWRRAAPFFCALAAAVVLLGLLARPLETGRVSVSIDLGMLHLPLRHFYARCLKTGEPFDWMPGMFGGFFLTGEGEHGPYHPLHLALYRLLPLDTAFAAETFLAYPAMLLGTFVFLRRHAGGAGALLGGLIYTFSANNVAHCMHLNYVGVIAHLPWQLWLLERLALSRGPARWLAAAGVALATGSQVLLGHPQAMSWSLLAEVLYAGFLASATPGPAKAALAWGVGKLLGLAVGGVQLLTTLVFLAGSNRGTFDPLYGNLPPSRLLQLLVPNVLGLDTPAWRVEPAYFGAVPLVLLAWWLAARRTRAVSADPALAGESAVHRLTGFAVVLGVLAMWLALGADGGLYLLHTRLPLVGQFRAPCRFVNLAAFAAAVLAAVGFGRLQAWVRAGRPLPWRQLLLPWAVALAAVAAAVWLHFAIPAGGGHGFDRRFLSGPATVVAAAGALTLAVRGRALGLYALIVLAGFDLYHFSLGNPVWGEPLWRRTTTLAAWKAATDLPPVPGAGRSVYLHWDAGSLLLHDERLLNGYHGGLEPFKRLDYTQLAALQVGGAAWYHEAPFGLVPVPAGLEAAGHGWHRVRGTLPRVRLVGAVRASDDPARDLSAIDPATTALTARPLALDGGPPGTAVLLDERPGRLRIECESPGRQLLVVAESHDPGWEARIDGVPVEVERVNGDFLGCAVEAGRHLVEFRFCPAVLRKGLLVSLAGLVAVLVLAAVSLASFWRTRREGANDRLLDDSEMAP